MTNAEQIIVDDSDVQERAALRAAPASSRWRLAGWLAGIAAAAAIAVGIYYYFGRPAPVVATPSPSASSTETRPAPNETVPTAPRYPIPEALVQSAPPTPLPALEHSDDALQVAFTELFGSSALRGVFVPHEIVRRVVVTVDNLPRKKVPVQLLPVRPAAGSFAITRDASGIVIAPENGGRYAPIVSAAAGIDAKKFVAAYVRFYPLFQEEYRLLGYPSGNFNDRVIEAIDDLLATPNTTGAVSLVQPKIVYEFADPDLEARSAGEKFMLRIGAENAAAIKGKLREIRHELTASNVNDARR